MNTHPLFFTMPQWHPHKSQSSDCYCRAGLGDWRDRKASGPGLQGGRLLGTLLSHASSAFMVELGSCGMSSPHPHWRQALSPTKGWRRVLLRQISVGGKSNSKGKQEQIEERVPEETEVLPRRVLGTSGQPLGGRWLG